VRGNSTPLTSQLSPLTLFFSSVIRFNNVYKAYPNGALALKDVTFHVSKGEFVFLTGHSGAGKSTIMKLLFAEQKPSGGEVRVSGYNVSALKPDDVPRLRRRLGVVFQDFRLLEDRTAAENIAFALEVTGARTDTIAARVMRVLTQVGLSAKSRAYPRELSGGEQQRVAIARALVNDPAILLADEPTGNLDERATRGVFQLLRDINAGGTVVVMATHDLDLVRQTSYRIIEMRDGSLVYDSEVDEPAAEAK
jgi:cell division transport system ATP-binding protein